MRRNTIKGAAKLILPLAGLAAVGGLLMFSSCYKPYDLALQEYDVVITTNNVKGTDFTQKQWFVMPDDIIDASDPDNPSPTQPPNAVLILDTIEDQLIAYGYSEFTAPPAPGQPADPDIAIMVAASKSDFYYYWDDCWYWYYYSDCYYWDYPDDSYYEYAYSTGTVLIVMGDKENQVLNDPMPILWSAGINGVLNDTSAGLDQRVEDAIEQAFSQSAFLKIN